MKAAAFEFIGAKSLDQALNAINQGQVDSKVMSGSQSLGPMLNLRLARPSLIVDISGLNALRQVQAANGAVRIGACVTHAEIEDGIFTPLAHHPWRKVAANIAYRSVRNRGTIGGSIAHADPAADWVLAACAVNAELEIIRANDGSKGKSSTRSIMMNDFMLAAYTTVLEANEIISAIKVPSMENNALWGYYKFCRKVGEFAESSCAAYFDPQTRTANIMIGALDGAPRNLASLASTIAQGGWSGSTRNPELKSVVKKAIMDACPERDLLDWNMYTTTVMRCLDRAFGVKDPA